MLRAADVPYEPIAGALEGYAQGHFDGAIAQLAAWT
jgi:hypothetical protein